MFTVKSVLLVTDAPHLPTPALQRARLIADEHGAELVVLEATPGADALPEIAAAAMRADLVVLGARRRNLLRELVLGTPAERVVRTSRRPVLVVKQAPTAAYRRVLVPVDLEAGSQAALQLAARLAPTAALHLFHALTAPLEGSLRRAGASAAVLQQHRNAAREASRGQLWNLAASVAPTQLRVSVEHGAPAWATLERARAVGADLIVVGKASRFALADFLLGNLARRLLAEATADVLVLPRAALAPAGAAQGTWRSTRAPST